MRVAKYKAKPRVKRCMAQLLGITSEIRSQDDWRQYWVKDYGARANLCHVLCREAGDECYMQSIWHEILTY